MELRLLTTDYERQIFAKCMKRARETRSGGWSETDHSALGKAHIAFGKLYALFENECESPERMVGGFITHDLASFPQSHPKPDLSHLPPQYVLEGGELWSLSKGIGRVARAVAAAVSGILQAKAILLYPMYRPLDLSASYEELGWVKACEPIKWPYAKAGDGSDIWAQPLVLEGEKLEAYIRFGFDFLFRGEGERLALRFGKMSGPQIPGNETEERPPEAPLICAAHYGDERNGSASL